MIKPRGMRWAGHGARMGENAYSVSMGKPEGKSRLGRPRNRLEVNIKTDITKIIWIRLPQNRYQWKALVNPVINLWVS